MQSPATQRPEAEIEMTEELVISSYMDGDHQNHPPGLLTPKGLQTWEMYHLIGDTLRSSELGFVGQASLSQKISLMIESESALVSASSFDTRPNSSVHATGQAHASSAEQPALAASTPNASSRGVPAGIRRPGLMRRVVWPSLAMAAAVASVVWVARPFFVPDQMVSPAQQVAVADPVKPVDPSAVNDYLQAHRQLSGPAAVRQVNFSPGNTR